MKFNLSTILAVATALSTASLSAASSIPNGGALKERGHCNPQWRGSYRYCDSDHRPQHEGEEPTKSPGCSTDGHNYAWASCTPDGHSGHVNDNDWYPGDNWCWVSKDQANRLGCNEDGTFELEDGMSCISWSISPVGSQRYGGCDDKDK